MAVRKKTAEDAEAVLNAPQATQDAPEAAEGTTTAPAAEAPQNAPTGAAEGETAPATEDAAEREKLVYVGPSLPRGQLKCNTIYEGTRAEIEKELETVLGKYPLVKGMLVPVSQLATAKLKIKTAGNALHKRYGDIESLIAAEIKKEG